MDPAFHHRVIAAAGDMMVQTTQKMLDQWQSHTDQPLDVVPAMSQLALTIVTKALFDYDIADEADEFSTAVQTLNQALGQNSFEDVRAYQQMPAAIRTIRTMVAQIVAHRRAHPDTNNDFLSLLMAQHGDNALTDRQIRDQIITLLLAGHETTAKAMSWTLYLVSQHPEVEQKIRAEIENVLAGDTPTVEHVGQLTYTWMAIEEAMRLYPPVWILSRKVAADDEIDGYHVPADSIMLVSPYAMHRHPRFWPQPGQFAPERFHSSQRRAPYTYLPFGGGPRLCIGRQFASLEMKLVLTSIWQRYRLHLVAVHPVIAVGLVSLNPRHGLPMMLETLRG
jgi:cytochrome P450